MKLTTRIIQRTSAIVLVILTLWSMLFYTAMEEEIIDEVDDAIDLYAENVITRYLAGKDLPTADNGTNNSYHLKRVTKDYAQTNPHLAYTDEMRYIIDKRETEPARVLKTIFRGHNEEWYELTVVMPTIEKRDLMEAVAYWVLGLYFTVVLTIIVVNAWIISRSMRPLYRLLKWLDRYNLNEEIEPIDNPTQITEFRTLNDTIQRFSQRNHQLFELQKRFIGDASHELQTPIAICQNRLEMLCDTELSEEQLDEIIKTIQTLEHLAELNRSLLLLSKIENGQFPDTIPVNMATLVQQARNEYRTIAIEKRISIKIHTESSPVWIMNSALAKTLIHNLYRNALVHNLDIGGEVHIHICSSKITFINTGSPITLDKEHIFDRFYKSNNKEHSTGLGLAIVKAISDLYGLTVMYCFEEGKHQFILKNR